MGQVLWVLKELERMHKSQVKVCNAAYRQSLSSNICLPLRQVYNADTGRRGHCLTLTSSSMETSCPALHWAAAGHKLAGEAMLTQY